MGKKTRIIKHTEKMSLDEIGGAPRSPVLDAHAAFLLLMPGLRLSRRLLEDQGLAAEIRYEARTGDPRIPRLRGLLAVGPRSHVEDALRRTVFVAPPDPGGPEALARVANHVASMVSRLPRSLVLVAQMSPAASIPAICYYGRGNLSKLEKKLSGEPPVLDAGPVLRALVEDEPRYGETVYVVDGRRAADPGRREPTSIYAALAPLQHTTIIAVAANAHALARLPAVSEMPAEEKSLADLIGVEEDRGDEGE